MTTDPADMGVKAMLAVAPFAEGGVGSLMFRAAENYAEDYVFDDGESSADYEPTERERMLLTDMVNGLFAEKSFWGPVAALLAHLASLEAENKALREEVKALAICPQFVAADKITMHGPSTTYPSQTAANHVRATITRLLTEIERIAGA